MAEFQSRPETMTGHRKWLWKDDGRRTDWKLDVLDPGDGASPHGVADMDDSRLKHYLRFGAIHSDIEEEKERHIPVDRKEVVVKWLVALAVAWLVFRFVRL